MHKELAGLAEASKIVGWSKQMLRDYISRGSLPKSKIGRGKLPKFPDPIQGLECGPIWYEDDIRVFIDEYVIAQARENAKKVKR